MQLSLSWLVAVVAMSFLTGLAAFWLLQRARRPPSGPAALPLEWDLLPRPVFTADERRLHRLLREALPHHTVLAKLPLVRFCQPADPRRVRYWYDLLGSTQVGFVICSANGRVLAAMDLSYDAGAPLGRATRIKQSVLGACRIRYLRCQADHLPSVPELQLLVPQGSSASRGPQPAQASDAPKSTQHAQASGAARTGRRERTALWQESAAFSDSFFALDHGMDTGHDDLAPLRQDNPAQPAMVGDDPTPLPVLRH
jgi:hypothetical protein